jgi:two-component system sensor histidine kinase DegS
MAVRLLVKNKKLEDADRQLEHLEVAAKGLFTDVREAILGLKMAGRTQLDLLESLSDYVQEFERLSGISTIMDSSMVDGFPNLNPEYELHIFRIVQEALNNVRKHSKATRANVNISRLDGTMAIKIEDNGIGFEYSDSIEDGSKLGLCNMKERASEIGAFFQISSTKRGGTCVEFTFPLIETEIVQ